MVQKEARMDKLEEDWDGMPGGFWKTCKPNQTTANASHFKTNECTKLFHSRQKLKKEKTIGIMNWQVIEFIFDKYPSLALLCTCPNF